MAAVTSVVISGAALAYSSYSAIDASNEKKSAKRALEGLTTPELNNVANDLQVSTLGADLRKEESARTTASSIDALRSGGQRALIGGISSVQANNDLVSKSISANLDEQQKAIDVFKAQDEQRIQGVTEQRYNNDVNALSSQINSANDAKNQAIANAFSSASALTASGITNPKTVSSRTPVESVSTLDSKSAGLTSSGTATIDAANYNPAGIDPFGVGGRGMKRKKYLTETN
jgi:hypothetical protein